jgi:hypothetical protein
MQQINDNSLLNKIAGKRGELKMFKPKIKAGD